MGRLKKLKPRASRIAAYHLDHNRGISLLIGLVLCVALGLTGFILDLFHPRGISGGVPYVALVLVGLAQRNRRAVLALAGLGTCLTVMASALTSTIYPVEGFLATRGLTLFTIWAMAAVAYLHLASLDVLEPLAATDALTGVHNRHYFISEMGKQIQLWKRYGHPLSLAILDIDHFKPVNDTYGHEAGDDVLAAVADACRRHTRESDCLARIGGEEFALLLPSTDAEGARTISERLREDIEQRLFSVGNRSIRLTVSLGVAELGNDLSDESTLFRAADAALYEAKDRGRNMVVVRRGPREQKKRDGLSESSFSPYTPQVY
ncbi:MAG: GGDEF domain-containing protein [Gemmatimonadota bacterium]|nr:GGDEF domain-containing protein [Gemmatimonadota bacterium]